MPVITAVRAEIVEIPLLHPFATARDHLARQVTRPVVITLTLDDGRVGFGEAVPVQYVTGETQETVLRAVIDSTPALLGLDLSDIGAAVRALPESLLTAPTARAGIEIALFDAYAGIAGLSLWQIWGSNQRTVETDITLPLTSDCMKRARQAAAQGFRRFKVKVGSGSVDDDVLRVMAIHRAVPDAVYRIDANQAFTVTETLVFIRRLLDAGVGLELIEQPVPKDDLAALDAVAAESPIPVFADEAVKTPADAECVLSQTRAHGINVKLMKSGITGALEIIRIAQEHGRKLMIGCMLETHRGIGVSLAFACGSGAFDYVDLDSHMLLADEEGGRWFTQEGPLLSVPLSIVGGCG